jgi:hypothetical protein
MSDVVNEDYVDENGKTKEAALDGSLESNQPVPTESTKAHNSTRKYNPAQDQVRAEAIMAGVKKKNNFAGMVYSQKLKRKIAVFHRKNESPEAAKTRVEANHKLST